ncbi:SRPBCC domain-containing protein [Solimonas sp. K1W22B-7]|uniref:SRPBCC family protein n=1 Tax=Solimonas sp. K1W22B-7 TaxID=2303331 RepID=UPI000E334B7E|nr:SRPBCC family protein [Solimonas sp. K1W22B-7]AXQ28800.1 SRPBCC domain-containing protein [Solimonas sp. K1W22B-7]
MQRPVLHSISVSHQYGLPLGEVFDAWIQPEALAQWLRMESAPPSSVALDRRVGGSFEIRLQCEGGEVPLRGSYLEIDRPSRLMFTWVSPGTDERESIVTLDLQPQGQGTRLTLTHDGLPSAQHAQEHGTVWSDLLGRLQLPSG